jgi:hypothetical protein
MRLPSTMAQRSSIEGGGMVSEMQGASVPLVRELPSQPLYIEISF